MIHSFGDAAKWAERFEDPERDSWQRPEYVISMMKLNADSKVADIGSATGYFPVRIARLVPDGMVYGIDIEADMVDYLNARAEQEGLANLKSILGQPENPAIPEPVDVIFLCNTYHHIPDRSDYFRRLKSVLSPGGRLMIVDFYKRPQSKGPPPEHKLAAEDVIAEIEAAGYALQQHNQELEFQYILLFEPAPEAGSAF